MGLNLLIAHGGGPTAVINSSLQGVIEAARDSRTVDKIYAARFGAEGLLNDKIIDLTDLTAEKVSLLSRTPATAIGSCRRKICDDDYPVLLECLIKYKINCFFYNGGNDSMDTCHKISCLAEREGLDVQVIGIPKTIDNDLMHTDHCPGFGSAARYAAISAAELSLDAAGLPIHISVLELMGRDVGWITAASAFTGKSTNCGLLIYLPEILVNTDKMLADIEREYAKGKGLLVVVCEGLKDLSGKSVADTGIIDGFGHKIPGGVAQAVSDMIIQKLKLKSRAEKPGHLGRNSIALSSATDREEAYAIGRFAVEGAIVGKTGLMASIEAVRRPRYSYSFNFTPLVDVANAEKKFPLEWIENGNRISSQFFEYCLPLLGDALPSYILLD
jgi:6-phosphofructokinase 1